MTPLSLEAAEIVTLTGVVPSVRRTTAFVVQPEGAVFACTCTRVMVTGRSVVQVEPVQVDVSAPGRKTFCSARGLLLNDSDAAPPRAIPWVKCCVFVQSCSASRCESGWRLPPLQFFEVATVPNRKRPGEPDVYVVSFVVRVETPFL